MTPTPLSPFIRKLRALLWWWTLGSVVVGGIGGAIGIFFTAPFAFGFFLGFVLTGMIGMFVIAVHLETRLK